MSQSNDPPIAASPDGPSCRPYRPYRPTDLILEPDANGRLSHATICDQLDGCPAIGEPGVDPDQRMFVAKGGRLRWVVGTAVDGDGDLVLCLG